MKKRPWPIVILAVLHILAAPGNLLMNAYLSHMTPLQKWAEYMMPQNIKLACFYLITPVIAGVAIYLCKRWSFWLYMVIILASCLSSYYGYRTKGHVSLALLLLIVFLDVAIVGYFMIPAVRLVYFDPRLRWWETRPRYKTDIFSFWKNNLLESSGQILNFSESGLFLKSAANNPQDGTRTTVQFTYDGKTYSFTGIAISHARQDMMGFGLKFEHTSESAKAAGELVKKLNAAGLLILERLPTAEDRFFHWLKRLITTGKGLLPESKGRRS